MNSSELATNVLCSSLHCQRLFFPRISYASKGGIFQTARHGRVWPVWSLFLHSLSCMRPPPPRALSHGPRTQRWQLSVFKTWMWVRKQLWPLMISSDFLWTPPPFKVAHIYIMLSLISVIRSGQIYCKYKRYYSGGTLYCMGILYIWVSYSVSWM